MWLTDLNLNIISTQYYPFLMKKISTLVLTVMLAVGSMLSVTGAPLSRRAVSNPIASSAGVSIAGTSVGQIIPVGVTRLSGSAPSADGIRRVMSPTQVRRTRALSSATAASRAMAPNLNLCGQVIYGLDKGWYSLPHTDGGDFGLLTQTMYPLNYGGYYDAATGLYRGVYADVTSSGSVNGIYSICYNPLVAGIVEGTSLESVAMMGISVAQDPTDGKVYGFYYNDNGSGYVWGTADYVSNVRTAIAPVESYLVLLACDNAGQFYGIDGDSKLYKVDKTSGDLTLVAQTALPYYFSVGCTINPANHTMLATCNTYSEAGLYEINLENGETTRLVDFVKDVQVTNLYIGESLFNDKSPAAPQLTVSAPEGTMTVHYALTLPDILMDGTPVTGLLDWQIAVDGEVMFEGRNQAGATVEGDLAVSSAGMKEFSATAVSADGASPKTVVRLFVGKGLPAAPENVKASYASGKMTVSWNPVTDSEDGGYINPAEVTYSVIQGSKFVAQNISATSLEFALEEPVSRTEYTYMVMAFYDGKPSEMGTSNTVILGAWDTPYSIEFNSTKVLTQNGYTVLDVNNDRKKWTASTNGVYYTYSNRNPADDWLVSPEINFEAGKVYEFSCVVYGRGRTSSTTTVNEKIEVKAGKAAGATVDNIASLMTMDVIPPTEITNLKPELRTISGLIAPTETGRLNIGLHAISDKNMDYLYVTEMKIKAGMDPSAPKAVTVLTVIPEATGLHTATISMTAPSETVTGTPLSGNVTMKIARNGEEIMTRSTSPGRTVTVTDEVPELGNYTYTVTTWMDDVAGCEASASAFVGPYAPAHPANVQMFESYQPGTVTLVWDAVTTDINGNPIPRDNVSYMIFGLDEDDNLVAKLPANVRTNTATFKAIEDINRQEFVQYIVYAYNREAQGQYGTTTDMIPVGNPYQMPFIVSKSEDLETYLVGALSNGATWRIFGDEKFSDVSAQDGDGQYFASETDTQNKSADLFSGRINITAAERPELSFYVMKAADDDQNIIDVLISADGEEYYLPSVNMPEIEGLGWTKVRYDLSRFAGKNIQFTIRSIHKNKVWTLVDNIRVQETPDKDVAALALTAPAVVKANEPFDISLLIANFGYMAARDLSVVLYRDGQELERRPVSLLEADEQMQVVFENVVSLFDENSSEAVYSAEILFDGDKDTSNNLTDEITVSRPASTLVAVTDLRGEQTAEGNKLTWTSAYGETPQPVEITEDFESAESWAHEYGQWTFYDGDREAVGGIEGVTIPGIDAGFSAASFFVMDNSEYGFEDFTAVSGHKFIASLCLRNYYNAVDDWAISPLLSGAAQTISFYASSINNTYPEKIEVWYTSEESTDIADFVQDNTFNIKTVPGEWTRYTAELPAGTKHFAIHSRADDNLLLMIDDVTFTPDPTAGAPVLAGYNIYRDGVKLNSAPVTEGEYTDTEAPAGSHTYHVTAVYDRGESELSNPVTLEQSGVEAVLAAEAKVAVEGNDIVVSCAAGQPVTIVAADGKVLHSATGDARVTVLRGVYMVTVGRKTVKLSVK